MSLFKKINGRTGEDIATEVVSYMIASPTMFVPFQKLFFNRILDRVASSTELKVEITTQPSFETGRPDIIILTTESLIIVETKLGSYLSGDNQLIKYCEVLQEEDIIRKYFPFFQPEKIKKRVIALLAPNSTISLSLEATNRVCLETDGVDFLTWCRQKEIKFVPLSWENILSNLDTRDSLQNELNLFVRGFTNQEFEKEEIMILQNKEVPSALNKLFNIIDDIRNFVSSKGANTGRMGQSYNYYGFPIELPDLSFWFGYFLPIWEQYQTPIFLQVRREWIKKDENKILKKLSELGFEQEEKHEFIRPFPLDSIDNWKNELLNTILRIK